jgi:hypothetical protein
MAIEKAAQAGYEAYLESVRPLVPPSIIAEWDKLPQQIRAAWICAAEAIVSATVFPAGASSSKPVYEPVPK